MRGRINVWQAGPGPFNVLDRLFDSGTERNQSIERRTLPNVWGTPVHAARKGMVKSEKGKQHKTWGRRRHRADLFDTSKKTHTHP